MVKKHNICHIVRHSKIAGTEKHVLLLVSGMDKEQFHPTVCTFELGVLADELERRGINTAVIPDSHSIFHLVKLVQYLRRNRFDVIHCHSGGYACLAARIAGKKRIVYTRHGIGFTQEELATRGFFRKFFDLVVDYCVDKYIALTEYDRVIMSNVMRVKSEKISVIWNGIDPLYADKYKYTKHQNPTIGVIARLTAQKGISYLIQAVPNMVKKYRNLEVLIAGDGEERARLENLAENLKVSKNIRFLGYVTNAEEVINRLDVFVLPSVWEGFPYVLLEAMILRKPIVATNIFGVSEIIDNYRTGILITPRSPDSITEAVCALLSDRKKARTLSDTAYAKVLRYYTLENTVRKIQDLYLNLLQ